MTINAHPIRTIIRILPVAIRLTTASAATDITRTRLQTFVLSYHWQLTLATEREKLTSQNTSCNMQ